MRTRSDGRPVLFALLLALGGGAAVQAQQSDSYRLESVEFNAGGLVAAVQESGAAKYALVNAVVGGAPSADLPRLGGSVSLTVGFLGAYAPPSEVEGLRFVERDLLVWQPDLAATLYNLYRGAIGEFGIPAACLRDDLVVPTAVDGALPSPSQGYRYLVTSENRLGEESTVGSIVQGDVVRPRPWIPCP